mmetsp:Transcript_30905/g.43266  ORF Transcript_30905/g.43266 Transcript_30905/m.43266 type:complete len:298 (-) Transcript_30905:163-1056(-)
MPLISTCATAESSMTILHSAGLSRSCCDFLTSSSANACPTRWRPSWKSPKASRARRSAATASSRRSCARAKRQLAKPCPTSEAKEAIASLAALSASLVFPRAKRALAKDTSARLSPTKEPFIDAYCSLACLARSLDDAAVASDTETRRCALAIASLIPRLRSFSSKSCAAFSADTGLPIAKAISCKAPSTRISPSTSLASLHALSAASASRWACPCSSLARCACAVQASASAHATAETFEALQIVAISQLARSASSASLRKKLAAIRVWRRGTSCSRLLKARVAATPCLTILTASLA